MKNIDLFIFDNNEKFEDWESHLEQNFAKETLKPKGVLVSKIFMGEDFLEVKNLAKSTFNKVNFFKL